MKKRTEIIIATVFSIVAIVMIGGCTLTQKESNKENQKVAYSKKAIKDDKEAIKQKQLAYLKNHEQEIIDLVKAQSPKIESVQIPSIILMFLGVSIILKNRGGEWIYRLIMMKV